MRAKLGMPAKLDSCYAARIGGYVIEGHVPVREIRRLLREQPKAIGLTVPGMVVGSPGMDGPAYKGRKDPYSVLLVHVNEKHQSFRNTMLSSILHPRVKPKLKHLHGIQFQIPCAT